MDKIYYEPQIDWDTDDFFYLHRVLHRIFFYNEKYADEIEEMDVSKMSEITRTLISCIIRYYHYEFLFEKYKNLSGVKNSQPLKETLVLDTNPLPEENVYKEMNIMY